MRELIEVVMEIWEDLKWQNDDDNGIIIGNLLFDKQYRGNRFIFILTDVETGVVKGYIESDGEVYFNVIGIEEWERFVDLVGW